LAHIRQSAAKLQWTVEEESGVSMFLLDGRDARAKFARRPAPRFFVSTGPREGFSILRCVAWAYGPKWDLRIKMDKLLGEADLVPPVREEPEGTPVEWKLHTPSWIKWTRAAEWSPFILLVLAFGFGIWLGWPAMLAVLVPWWFLLVAGPTVVVDAACRRALGIQSKRGMLARLSANALTTLLFGAIPFVVSFLPRLFN
jgi:hypothetical protein